jgi:hypothetical protein
MTLISKSEARVERKRSATKSKRGCTVLDWVMVVLY